jgi:hypothetical protein
MMHLGTRENAKKLLAEMAEQTTTAKPIAA